MVIPSVGANAGPMLYQRAAAPASEFSSSLTSAQDVFCSASLSSTDRLAAPLVGGIDRVHDDRLLGEPNNLTSRVEVCADLLHWVRIGDERTFVLLPPSSSTAQLSWQTYLEVMRSECVFASLDDSGAAGLYEHLGALTCRDVNLQNSHPRVGIMVSSPHKLAPQGDWYIEQVIQQVVEAGCVPVLIPPLTCIAMRCDEREKFEWMTAMANSLDGLIGPGGDDVHPELYGEVNRYGGVVNLVRDQFESDFVKTALHCELSALGICRSHQLWSVTDGASIIQDLVEEGLASGSRDQREWFSDGGGFSAQGIRDDGESLFENRVKVEPFSMLSQLIPSGTLTNTFHHQAVRRRHIADHRRYQHLIPVGFVYDQVGEQKKTATVEAAERLPNVMTVQFHPEFAGPDGVLRDYQVIIFGAFFRRAQIYRIIRQLRTDMEMGSQSSLECRAVIKQMKILERNGEVNFESSDYHWVNHFLAPVLRRSRLSVWQHARYFDLSH